MESMGYLLDQFGQVISLLLGVAFGSAFAFKLGIVINAVLEEFRCSTVQCNGNIFTWLVSGFLQ